ncbi:MAG: hypothetical protein DLM59_20715 [Pseudonocardiales bacterium]|nr:MAG: hypothetical protein DLM59_20715 [Pseudonocardiales bacterium]
MTERGRPLLISEFARRCRLPVSALRYYDKIGLLPPAVVDPSSGYRRYTADQLASAVLISRLRAIGTAPRDIARALVGGTKAAAVLAAERQRVAGQVADGQRALAVIDALLAHHDKQPTHDVELVGLALEHVVTAPFRAAHGDVAAAIVRAIAGLRGVLRRTGHGRCGPWGATLPLEMAERVSGFVFAHTSQPIDHAALDTAWLPATQAWRTTHHGGPDTLAAAYGAVLEMIDRQGWTPTGPVIEEYLTLDTSPTAAPSIRLSVPIA